MENLLNKLRKFEIRIRKAINTHMHGDFTSVFKGSGLQFDDVRSYQYGDDVRTINWNVSAKGHGTFVKTFKEEKEQNVFFILDVSGSQEIGMKSAKKKIEIGKEICGVLTLSAIKESGNVGLIGYSDDKEIYIKPDKGMKHAYYLILKLFKLQTKSVKTNLNKGLKFTLGLLKRKSVVILISDFIDTDYEQNLIALAKKHDLVVIHLSDVREVQFPKLGIIPLYDKENKKTIWINSSSSNFRASLSQSFSENQKQLEQLCRKYKASYLWIDTRDDYVLKLVKLFQLRSKNKRSA
ncbi:MAG TPA: DUF58 domain-containing protein [Cytophagaceae bacterium]